jgi:hypothetical protein
LGKVSLIKLRHSGVICSRILTFTNLSGKAIGWISIFDLWMINGYAVVPEAYKFAATFHRRYVPDPKMDENGQYKIIHVWMILVPN